MKIDIKYRRLVQKEDTMELDLPTVPVYYFLTGRRISFALKPIFHEFDHEHHKAGSLMGYNAIVVDGNKIIHFRFAIHEIPLRIAIHEMPSQVHTKEPRSLQHVIINHLVHFSDEGIRTKKQFMTDLDNVRKTISDIIDNN